MITNMGECKLFTLKQVLGFLRIHNNNLTACGGMILEIFFFFNYRVWVPVLPKKVKSTSEIWIKTGRNSHGRQRKMGRPLKWHSARKRLMLARAGCEILKYDACSLACTPD